MEEEAFFRRDGKSYVRTDGAAHGRLSDFQIKYTFGVAAESVESTESTPQLFATP